MKKLITLLTAAVLCANTVLAADVIKQDYNSKDDSYLPVYELGIISADDAEEDAVLTRGEFVKIAYNIKNYQNRDTEPSANTSYFDDVGVYHYAAGYIQFLVGAGVVKGYETGDFRPEQEITADEAARMLLRCAGYGVYEDYGFGDLSSFIAEIKKGVGKEVTYENAAKMIYNLLFTETMKLTTTSTGFGYETADIALREVLDMDYIDGTLEAVGGNCIYDKDTSKSEIIVDGESLENEEKIDSELLGMYVRVIFEDGVALAAMPLKNTVLTIDAEDIDSLDGNKLSYYDGEKSKSIKLAGDKDILYNGYAVGGLSDKLPKNGSIKLIDRKSDGIYDVALVEDYESYLVKSVGLNSEDILVKTLDGDKTISLKSYDTVEVVNEKGEESKLSRIAENNVVMIYAYENEYIKVAVVANQKDITIKGFGTNQNGKKVVMSDEEEFVLTDGYWYKSEPALGENVTLCMDTKDRVVGMVSKGVASWKYGYVIFARMADNDDGEDRVLLKLVNESGEVEKIYCDEKTHVNGTKMAAGETLEAINSAYNNFADTLTVNGKECENYTTRLIRYYQSGEVIKRLDTPILRSMYSESKIVTSSNDQLLLHTKGSLYNPENQTGFKVVWGDKCDLAGDIFFDQNSIIFIIPESSNTNPDDEDYGIMKGTAFKYSSGKEYYAAGYTCDGNGLTTSVAVVRKNKGESSDLSTLMINHVNRIVGDDDEILYQIESVGGSKLTVNEKSSSVSVPTLKDGDIVLYEVSNGEMIISKILYSGDGSGYLSTNKYYSSSGDTHFNVPFRALLGTAGKRDGSYMQVSLTGIRPDEVIAVPNSVYVYDKTDGKDKYYAGTRNDISYGDGIIITSRKGVLSTVFVIKK